MTSSVRARRNRRSRGPLAAANHPPGPRSTPSLPDALARFSDALSLLAVAHTSLTSKELAGTGDEGVAIHHALDTLKRVYAELDRSPSPTLTE